MALLAENDETFRGLVDAFLAQDGESMQRLLNVHGLADNCEVVCHWLRSKECNLLCLELSGPPVLDAELPTVVEFAQLMGRLADDEDLVALIALAIDERNRDSWVQLIRQNDLERFSHLLCHWACTVHFRLVCEVVCQPTGVRKSQLVPALQAAGQAIGRLAADPKIFEEAAAAADSADCERLRTTLKAAPFATSALVICEWFCSWHSPRSRHGLPVRAVLHPVLPLGVLPALPDLLLLR